MVGPSLPPYAPLPSSPPRLPPVTDPKVQPPRPPNSWILYRAWRLKHLPPPGPGEGRRSQSDVSTLVSRYWRTESQEVKDHFERLADEAKAIHKSQYPNYRYQPKKREDGKPPRSIKPKKAVQLIRGASRETDATPAPVGPLIIGHRHPSSSRPSRELAGTAHPYPSSSRPIRQSAVRIPASPPISAASSPSIGPSTPTSTTEFPEMELEPSSSREVVDLTSPSPVASAGCQSAPQTPAPETFDSPSISSENLQHGSQAFDNATENLYQPPASETFGDSSIPPVPPTEASVDTSNSPLHLPETPAIDDTSKYPHNIPTNETAEFTNSWNFSTSEIPLNFVSSVQQDDAWPPELYFANTNTNNQQATLSYQIPVDSSDFGTGTGENEVMACGHPAMGEHSPQCFLAHGTTEQYDRDIEIILGNAYGVVNPYGNEQGDVLSTDNAPYEIPLYPQDASSMPFSLEQDHSAPSNQDFSFEGNNFYFFDNALTEEVPQPPVQAMAVPPYVPPSGAAQSATRRVGGNWSGFVREMDIDLNPASHFEVHAS